MGTGYIPQGEDDLYKTQDTDYLSGTGEVVTMAYYSDEILDKSMFPKKMLVFSPCFRREAGEVMAKTREGLFEYMSSLNGNKLYCVKLIINNQLIFMKN